jgi:hypothetical protein
VLEPSSPTGAPQALVEAAIAAELERLLSGTNIDGVVEHRLVAAGRAQPEDLSGRGPSERLGEIVGRAIYGAIVT